MRCKRALVFVNVGSDGTGSARYKKCSDAPGGPDEFDSERSDIMKQRRTMDRQLRVVVRNERLTAITAAVLLMGFIVDLVVTANLSRLIMVHIFIGTLLVGPLVVKLTSVGYRFHGYYTKSPAFVAKGPPNVWMRLLAPFFIADTLALFISGLALALAGSPSNRLLFLLHAGTAALWVPMLAVHVYAHIRQVPRAIARDWAVPSRAVGGRIKRLRINILALIVGAITGAILTSAAAPWRQVHLPPVIPSPLVLGLVAAFFGVLIAIPLLRGARE